MCVSARLLNFIRLHSHMHSAVSGQSANFKVQCVHRPGAKTICQGADHSLSTGRRAVTGNSIEGISKGVKCIFRLLPVRLDSAAQLRGQDSPVDSSPKPMQSYSSTSSQLLVEINTSSHISEEVLKYWWW